MSLTSNQLALDDRSELAEFALDPKSTLGTEMLAQATLATFAT